MDLTTLSSLHARRTFKTVVKRKFLTSPIDPFVTSDVPQQKHLHTNTTTPAQKTSPQAQKHHHTHTNHTNTTQTPPHKHHYTHFTSVVQNVRFTSFLNVVRSSPVKNCWATCKMCVCSQFKEKGIRDRAMITFDQP